MQKRKAISERYRIIPLALAVIALLCSCADSLPEKAQEPTMGGGMKNLKIPKQKTKAAY